MKRMLSVFTALVILLSLIPLHASLADDVFRVTFSTKTLKPEDTPTAKVEILDPNVTIKYIRWYENDRGFFDKSDSTSGIVWKRDPDTGLVKFRVGYGYDGWIGIEYTDANNELKEYKSEVLPIDCNFYLTYEILDDVENAQVGKPFSVKYTIKNTQGKMKTIPGRWRIFEDGTGDLQEDEGIEFSGDYEFVSTYTPVEGLEYFSSSLEIINEYSHRVFFDEIDESVKVKKEGESEPADISDAEIGTIPDQVYSGKFINPAVTVTYKGRTLTEGEDYSVSLKDNKEIGQAKVTVKGKGDLTGENQATFKIIPKGVKISKVTAGKKMLTVKWKKGKNITGYEIEYSLKEDFSGSKKVTVSNANDTEKEIKKLKKKKTYYIRIRTYRKVGGKKYYSEWSKVQKKKTK